MCPRILLVEDDKTLRFLTADALAIMDIDVIECETADDGLKRLEDCYATSPVDLIMTDIRMPGYLDGLQLARIIWQRWPHLPVILTSGHRLVMDTEMPAHSAFIAKPWTLDQLFDVVQRQLSGVVGSSQTAASCADTH
jgi:DNA-binding NtrC family response regulator